ncbi:MAG: alpha-amylase family glycosyl hydrolase [Bacteroidota bacterium]
MAVFLLLLSLAAGCQPRLRPGSVPTATLGATAVPGSGSTEWWRDAVFYEIFVRSFYDSNGDGVGDFKGIIEKLDYLNDGNPETKDDLGITGIWLMPIFPSPSYHGYDVTDFYAVNPQYGTMEDFKLLLREAHKRGIHVIIDMVLNHTSDKIEWFRSARADVNSPYRDWYIWRDTDPKYKGPWGERVWHPSPTGYYYGIFESFMPDLNYKNPQVTKEMDKVITFWLKDVGVDGFRLDAVKHLIEEGNKQQNTVSTHKWLIDFRPVYKAARPDALTVGEISGDPPQVISDYTAGNQLDLAFNFQLAGAFLQSALTGQASFAANELKTSSKVLKTASYAPFLTNHDQNRVMSQLNGDLNKAKTAASLLLTSPGTPFLYYGEEIGMQGKKPDQDIRLPMQWSGQANAGFTTGRPWRAPTRDFPQVNVAAQESDPGSLLAHYRELIALRTAHPGLRSADISLVEARNPAVFASLRIEGSDRVLVLVNLGEQPVRGYSLSLSGASLPAGQYAVKALMGGGEPAPLQAGASGGFESYAPFPELAPYATYVLQLEK